MTRAAAEEIVEWWRGYRGLVSVPEWHAPLIDKIADAVAQAVAAERERWIESARAAVTICELYDAMDVPEPLRAAGAGEET